MLKQKIGQTAYYGVWIVLIGWAAATISLELFLGWPQTREALGHRLIGWFINLLFLRTFLKGYRRYQQLRER